MIRKMLFKMKMKKELKKLQKYNSSKNNVRLITGVYNYDGNNKFELIKIKNG